jgi:hypothetical protein
MSNAILLAQVTSLLQNSLSYMTQAFIQGFLPLDKLPTMIKKSCLPAT